MKERSAYNYFWCNILKTDVSLTFYMEVDLQRSTNWNVDVLGIEDI